MNTQHNRTKVEQILKSVSEDCRAHRALVLTESDLKCQIYLRLSDTQEFGRIEDTYDSNVTGSAIHTETKFFDQHGLLRKAPDLVLTSPSRLSIKRRLDGAPLPSKGFHFDGSAILIELKFLKQDSRPTAAKLKEIRHDIMKGEALNQKGQNFHLIVAVFDRFTHGQDSVEELFHNHRNQQNLTCLYFSGGPSFRTKKVRNI